MYNQKRWRPGKFIMGNECEMCQCFGHADECFFDPQVEAERRSFDTDGKLEGGGVCMGCRDDTTGVNCHLCKEGFFRPAGVSRFDKKPCQKCTCDTFGTTGACYPDGSKRDEGHEPGHCICKPGYSGSSCTECAEGFHDYPKCAPCPCSLAGTLNGECDGDCLCKEHVQGVRCDQCQPGYYALHEANAKGCLKCFCYGISSECDAAELGVEKIQHAEGWVASDLRGTLRVEPFWSTMTSGITIADEEMHDADTYFWQAPKAYIGNKLISYGQIIRVSTSWHRGRGDTSGYFTKGPDLILQGAGMLIACGFADYPNTENTTLEVNLVEEEWYHIPEAIQNIPASDFRNEPSSFIGRRVFKDDFMKVLGGLQRLLVRAKFHTDQLEGTLHTAALEIGSQKSSNLRKTWAVESCTCPLGYEGLSCEKCSYGYTRVNNTLFAGECRKCNCNGHSASCDPFTLQCEECLHNTEGVNCEKCKVGFYGNPVNGSPTDCKPCKCPLEIESNNFSPSCVTATLDYDRYSIAPEEYICTDCPKGYAGSHCERLANSVNLVIAVETSICLLLIGVITGPANAWVALEIRAVGNATSACLVIGEIRSMANVMCWKGGEPTMFKNYQNLSDLIPTRALKRRSSSDHYMNACNCNEFGSKHSNCNLLTGQCECKDKYVGRTCSQCKDGFGNIKAGCRHCNCHPIGSESDGCDADSGQCRCHEGITGLTCDSCLANHYGFSRTGCQNCNCHPQGSKASQCDLRTGSCSCYDHVVNRECYQCRYGYWNINSGQGCEKCACDPMGSKDNDCHDITGACKCKQGVGGTRCAECQEGYWGISSSGCIKCEPCSKPGHICDPDTGRCICPPLTEGASCETCQLGTWDYDSYKGCKYCQCHTQGSISTQCEPLTGQCKCLQGFTGPKCDQCRPGFYNFPHCRPCNCDPAGTRNDQCAEDGSCRCDMNGTCKCKENVEGKKCASCRRGTYGLSNQNPEGCFQCFCFGRSNLCEQAPFQWTQLTFFQGRNLIVTRGQTQLNQTHGLLELPKQRGDIKIGVESLFTTPLYWRLPDLFNGDKILSYNGFLRFSTASNGPIPYSPGVLDEYPLVQIIGNSQVVLEHFPRKMSSSGSYEVRMHEDEWVVKETQRPATREMIMVALQDVQKILIRSSDAMESTKTQLKYATLDVAKNIQSESLRPAVGVEMCQCPPEYQSSSCQDPGRGFYRLYESHFITSETMIRLIGRAQKCNCNGRADQCHPHTGHCIACQQNTAGPHCNTCAMGHYGDPESGIPCLPCRCPTAYKNFAQTCSLNPVKQFNCVCREGYTGPQCDRCEEGYYGQPMARSGQCQPCSCHPLGSRSDQCDDLTGQCQCMPGVTGRDCSQCSARHILTKSKTCHDCNDMCTGTLLNEVLNMANYFNHSNALNIDPTPDLTLKRFDQRTQILQKEIKSFADRASHVRNLESMGDFLKPQADLSSLEAIKLQKLLSVQTKRVKQSSLDMSVFKDQVTQVQIDVEDIIRHLRNYAIGESADIKLRPALEEARNMLRSIQRRDPSPYDIMVRTELSRARQTLSQIKGILYERDLALKLKERILLGEAKINDLLKFMDIALVNLKKSFTFNYRQNSTLNQVMGQVDQIQYSKQSSENHLKRGIKLSRESKVILQGLLSHLDQMKTMFQRIDYSGPGWNSHLNRVKDDLRQLGSQFVYPCRENADKLMVFSNELKDMFENTVDVSMGPTLKAARAYQTIMMAMEKARDASYRAMNAAIKADDQTAILKRDRVGQSAEASRVRSEDLSQEAEGLRQNSVDMGYRLQWILKQWQEYTALIEDYGKTLELMRRDLGRVTYVSDKAQEAVHMADNALGDVERVGEGVTRLHFHITKDLFRRAQELSSFSVAQLNQIPSQLNNAGEDFQRVEKQATYLHHRTRDVEELSATVNKRLAELKRKVVMAQHAASGVKISIANDWEEATGCVRSFRVNMSTSTTTEISLFFAVDTPDRDGLLVYLPSTQHEDFMAIEMVDRRIRFLWNNGAGTQVISHNVTIETSNDLVRDEHAWYKITAQRVGNIGRLNVKKVTPIFDVPGYHRWIVGESPPNAQILDLQPTDLLYVGGVPDAMRSQKLRSEAKFNGVLYEMYVNNEKVGLWNFVTTRGCLETHMGISDKDDGSGCYTFNGQGYATQKDIGNYDPKYLSLAFEFKTFDAHATLMLIHNPVNNQYMALTIKHGKVQLQLAYGSGSTLTFETTKTYNSGDWVKVEGARAIRNDAETGVLRVTFNGITEDQMSTIALPDPEMTFDMTDSVVYFGGVPPTYDPTYIDLPTRNLLGSLRAISLSNPESNGILNPFNFERFTYSPFHGVESNCERKVIKVASFEGDGHLEVPSHDLKKHSTMSLTFATREPIGLLLLSTFQGQDAGPSGDFYSIAMVDGKLAFKFGSTSRPRDPLSFTSNLAYNDGQFHAIVIHRMDQTLRILVDDQEISPKDGLSLHRSIGTITGPQQGGLYLAGVPSLLDFAIEQASMAPTIQGFRGTLKDVLLLDRDSVRVVALNEPTSFSKADIGRYMTWFENNIRMTNFWHVRPRPNVANQNSSSQALHCQKDEREPLSKLFAAQFSRSVGSSITARLRREEIQKEFDLSLWIRTFDQDGLIMASITKKSALYVFLQDGEMKVKYVQESGQEYQMEVKDIFDHGIWKEIRLSKKDNALSLTVDSRTSVTIEVPKRLHLAKTVAFGGSSSQEGLVADIPYFNGCMKDIKILSRRLYLHTETNKAHNIFPCSKRVERGFHLSESFMSFPLKREILEVDLKFSFKHIKAGMLGILQKRDHNITLEITHDKVIATLHGLQQPVVLQENVPPPSDCGTDPWNTLTITTTNKAFGIQLNDKVGKATPINTFWSPGGEIFFGGAPFIGM
eukprot:TCALIF_01772-PA protein Name:"Similar to Lama1 Laminin subunit alpha-1 (Mus musculus)" AED:0.11 eAED:0.12 QI:0/0.86/0.58/1/0.95/0.95/24/1780/2877